MSEPLLVASAITVRAGARTLVDRVIVTAHAGEITLVIGPNGSGKSRRAKWAFGPRRTLRASSTTSRGERFAERLVSARGGSSARPAARE
jgi:ABC-type hemin transport system ATPase subunit